MSAIVGIDQSEDRNRCCGTKLTCLTQHDIKTETFLHRPAAALLRVNSKSASDWMSRREIPASPLFFHVFSYHYRGNLRHNMLQYSSRSTLRATPELCRFFLAPTVVWKPCQWWSNVAFMWCFSSSPLIRLEINNAYATLTLSFLEGLGKLLFFSIFFELGAATLADCPSALWNDKDCTP